MTTLTTLPPELRTQIYSHLFANSTLHISSSGALSTTSYPHQLALVSRLFHTELLPFLHQTHATSTLHLHSSGGRFPAALRRRIPLSILRNIRLITIHSTPHSHLAYDELKPTLTTFPRLEVLRFDLRYVTVSMVRMLSRHNRRKREYSTYESGCIEVRRVIQEICWDMHLEQERPREGLERDYFAEHTLFDVLMKARVERGFRVEVVGRELAFENKLNVLPGVHFDWDDFRED